MEITITEELLNKVRTIVNSSEFIQFLLDISEKDLEVSGLILQILLNEIDRLKEKEV
jgi:hypothetical protein